MLKAAMDEWGMKMHLGKTKVMVIGRVAEECNVTIDGEKIEEVQSLKYLGSIISADGLSDEDIEQRTNRGCNKGGWCDEEGSDGAEGVE